MSICGRCSARSERACTYIPQTREYYGVLIAALRHVAYRCGYALAVHGSLKTDIDLLAAPWREGAVNREYLAEEIRKTAEQIIGFAHTRKYDVCPIHKPEGRLAWTFYLVPEDVTGPYIDLSVMPRPKDLEKKKK